MKTTSVEHGQNMFCGLVDARISASEKDLPVPKTDNLTEQNRVAI